MEDMWLSDSVLFLYNERTTSRIPEQKEIKQTRNHFHAHNTNAFSAFNPQNFFSKVVS